MSPNLKISAVCPVFNEADHISDIITFFINASPKEKELIIVDGGSDDGTVEIIKKFTESNENIRLLHNPDKYVPFALNKGIKNSKSDIIVRMDGHSEYAEDFFIKVLETFRETDADIVGSHIRTKSTNNVQSAIARVMNTPFGIGDSKVHFEGYEGYSDTVYQGSYKKEVFDDIGYFDERLLKNQDDEFHYRANSMGKKVYVSSKIRSWYYPRSSIPKVFRHYFLFGFYKPMVLKKVKTGAKIRHIIPSGFCLYIMSLFFGIYYLSYLWIIPLILYFAIDLYFAFNQKSGFKVKFITMITYPAIHIAYGSGFISGLFRK